MKKEFITNEIEDLNFVANFIVNLTKKENVFYLKGDLGAGKTTLIQKICSKLGSNDIVVSPSFALINVYNSKAGEIFHIDLYRLNNIEEAVDLGIEDYLYSNNLCFIEWPQLIESISPDSYIEININITDNNSRKIKILRKENK